MRTPIFTSSFSLKSILQIKPNEGNPNGPASIYDIAKKNNLKQVFLLDRNMTGFLEANKYINKEFQLVFGINFLCSYGDYKFRFNVFAANTAGTKKLQKLYSKYAVEYKSCIPIEELNKNIDSDLIGVIPFYDSHIYRNLMGDKIFVDFGENKPVVFLENNGVLYDDSLRQKAGDYAAANNLDAQEVKTVLYEKKEDFDAWQTYMCIQKREKLESPNMQFCDSDEFCMEALNNE